MLLDKLVKTEPYRQVRIYVQFICYMKPLSMSILKLTMSVVHAIYMLIDSTMNELYGNSLLVLQLLRSISHSVEIIHLYTILLFG